MTKKGWLIFFVVCIALLGGLVYISRQDKVNVDAIDIDTVQAGSESSGGIGDRVFGKADSKVVLIEYGDYVCPGCASTASVLMQVAEKYQDKIAFVYRNFPLVTIHPNALTAAAVAEAAGEQGKYWQMNEALYANQNSWKDLSGNQRVEYFVNLATSLGLDSTRLKTDLDSPNIQKKIEFDRATGAKKGVTGTPSIYLNGENVSDKYFKDGKLVEPSEGAAQVWSDAEAFDNLIIKPALEKHGIK